MSELDWGSLEPKHEPSPLTGPEQILTGKGCRLILKTTEAEDGRDQDMISRLYRVVVLLSTTGCAGVDKDPQDGYVRIFGGEDPFYVRGTDQKSVITTIGRGVLAAPEHLRREFEQLGIRALVEW